MVCHVDFSVEAIQLSSPPLMTVKLTRWPNYRGGGGATKWENRGSKTFCVPLRVEAFCDTPPPPPPITLAKSKTSSSRVKTTF